MLPRKADDAGLHPKRTVVGGITQRENREHELHILPGEWEVWLVEGNRYMIVRNGSMLFEEGRYRLTRQELALTPDATDFPCMLHLRPEWASATYRWATDGQSIVLTGVQEKCPGRLLVLSLHALVRQD